MEDKICITHADIAWQSFKMVADGADLHYFNSFQEGDFCGKKHGNISIPLLAKSNVDVVGASIYVESCFANTGDPVIIRRREQEQRKIYAYFAKTFSENIELVSRGGDLDSTKIKLIPSLEGASMVENEGDFEDLLKYYKIIGFSWDQKNNLASGLASSDGLTDLGKWAVKRANNSNVLLDASHLNERSFYDLVEIGEKPIIASHSNVHSLSPHPRNLKDEQIKMIAERGGVVGINFGEKFLRKNPENEVEEVFVENVLDHIEYIIRLVGENHVGLGTDYDGTTVVDDLRFPTSLHQISSILRERGFGEGVVRKIMRENFMRVFRETF